MKIIQQSRFSQDYLQTISDLEDCQPLWDKTEEAVRLKSSVVRKRVLEHNKENAPFRAAFCGVFSAGKSSLINALLQCEYKLPTGINPITKIVTRIRYGKELSCFYYHNGNQNKLDKQETLKVIKGELALSRGCDEVILEMPAEILKNHIEFLDTPGFDDEMGGELEAMSRKAITDADLVILCCSALPYTTVYIITAIPRAVITSKTECCFKNMVASIMDSIRMPDPICIPRCFRSSWLRETAR